MPNTVVKLTNAESTWLEAAREDRKLLINTKAHLQRCAFCFAFIWFRVQGSRVRWRLRRFFYWGDARKWYFSHALPVITTIRVGPWRRPAPKAQDGSTKRCERLCEITRLPPVIPIEVEGSFLQTGKSWVRERRKRKHQGVV